MRDDVFKMSILWYRSMPTSGLDSPKATVGLQNDWKDKAYVQVVSERGEPEKCNEAGIKTRLY